MDEVVFDISLLGVRDHHLQDITLQDKAVGKFKACPKTRIEMWF